MKDKIKTILLVIFGTCSFIMVVYFSLIDPIVSGVREYGVPGFAIKVVEFLALSVVALIILEYERNR